MAALRARFGPDVDVTSGSTLMKIGQALAVLPLAEMDADMDDLYANMFVESSRGEALRKHLEPLGFNITAASRSEGDVHVTLGTGMLSPPEVDPYFPAGSLVVRDSGGRRYDLIEDASLPGRVFDNSTLTGTASETVDVTQTRIAQRFTLAEATLFGHFDVKTTTVGSAPSFLVRVETDSAGSPTGTLADTDLELVGFQPVTTVLTQGHFTRAALLPAGTYWLVFTRTAGGATFDGAATGTADQVKVYDGSWSLDGNVKNLNASLFGDITLRVRSQTLGSVTNAAAEAINRVILQAGVTTRWNNNVESFTNYLSFEGGRNLETDSEYRTRFFQFLASREVGTPDGIAKAVSGVIGVTGVTVVENTGDDADEQDTFFEHTGTASVSDTIDGTTTRIAQKFTIAEQRFLQYFAIELESDNSSVFTVTVEPDTAGSPSGAPAAPQLSLTGFTPGGTALTTGSFAEGAYIPAGSYWTVFTRTAGDATFEGSNTGTADQVKTFSGSWAVPTNPDNLRAKVYGGLPPHSFRVYPSGGDDDDIAQAIWDTGPAGIRADGSASGTAVGRGGVEYDRNFERPTQVPVVLDIEISKNANPLIFSATVADVRNIVIDYIGGARTDGVSIPGLGVALRVIRSTIVSMLRDRDYILGTVDVLKLRLGRKVDFATPGDLTSVEVTNLVPSAIEEFIIEFPTDIGVTLTNDTGA